MGVGRQRSASYSTRISYICDPMVDLSYEREGAAEERSRAETKDGRGIKGRKSYFVPETLVQS